MAVLLCATVAPVSLADSLPDWLAAANRVDLGQFGRGSAAVVVGQWRDFTVDATGKFISIERRAIRVLDRKSAEPYLRAAGAEGKDSAVTSIQTWSIAPTGRVIQSGKKDVITTAAYAEFELFSDYKEKFVQAPGAEQGSLVGFEVVRQGRIPISGEAFALEDEIPVYQGELHVAVPSGSLRWFANHPDRVEIVEQSATSATFRTASRPGISFEQNAPPFSSLASYVIVNYDAHGSAALKSWEEAGRINHELFSPAEKPGTEITAEVDKLAAEKSTLLAKMDAVYTFVSRQIRYVAIEIGVGGFQPHAAPDVFKYKYGDCKDKATLLLTMLDHIGLRGYPALVGTRGDIEADPKAPTLATFDHMIVALPVPANLQSAVEDFPAYDTESHILWMDPTSESAPIGQLPEMDQGVYALISHPDGGDLRRIPEAPPEENGVEYDAQLRLQPDGSGVANVEAKYLGVSNARNHGYYRGRSQSEIRRMFEERIAHYVNQASFQKASITGTEDNNQQIVETFSFSGNFALASNGDSWFFQPMFLSGMAVPEVGTRPRTLPMDIGTPFSLKADYSIELPAGMRLENMPEENTVQSDFGRVHVDYEMKGNVLQATKTITFTLTRIPPEKYPAFRDFVNSFLRMDRQRLRLVKN
jgi:hypothetical protein